MAIRSISATIRNLNPKDFKERSAKPEDCSTLIDEDTIVTVDGRIVLVYI